jgi:hypothetical protein
VGCGFVDARVAGVRGGAPNVEHDDRGNLQQEEVLVTTLTINLPSDLFLLQILCISGGGGAGGELTSGV